MNQKAACQAWNELCFSGRFVTLAVSQGAPDFIGIEGKAKGAQERAAAAHFLRMFADAIEGEDGQPSPPHEEEEEK